MNILIIYSIAITIVAIKLAISTIRWIIGAKALTFFCAEKFREPTDEEMDYYISQAQNSMKRKK